MNLFSELEAYLKVAFQNLCIYCTLESGFSNIETQILLIC